MAVNKNFIVKNGLEVDTNLIVANADTNRVGIGTTVPQYTLHVFEGTGIGATSIFITGITTVINQLRVGTGGTIFSVIAGPTGTGQSVGVGTPTPAFLLDVHSPVSTGQTALRVRGDGRITGDLVIESDVTLRSLNVTGVSTFVGFTTFQDYVFIQDGLNVTGTGATIETLAVSGVTTTQHLNVTGVSTFVGFTTFQDYVFIQDGLNVTGTGATLSTLNVTGVSTFGGNLNIKGLGDDSIIEHANASVGDLYLLSKRGTFIRTNNGEASGYFRADGAVELYYDNSKKFETTGYGATVYGTLESQQLNVTGVSTFVGFTTFQDYVFIQDGLNVTGTGATIETLAVSGVTTTQHLNVTGVSTFVGFTTFQDYVFIQDGLNVTGTGATLSTLNVTGVSTFGGNLNIKGLGDDSIIEHANASVGDLYLLSKRGTFIRTNNGEASGYFRADGAVELYYDNSKKFETTGAGVTVYGTLESQQLNVTGIATASSFKGSSQVGIATAGGYLGLTTQFKFVGSGVTITSEYDSNVGITTLTFIGSSGGGGGGTPGGSTGEIQYNNSGSFGGVSNFTYNGTDLNFVGIITATSFVKSGGTSSQFLKADGSVDTSTYLTSYSETSTLNDVLTRGNVSGIGISVGISTFSGNVFVGSGVVITSNDISVAGIVTATDFNSTSDQNLKTNIQTVHNALGIVEHLRGVRFDWKKDHKPSLGVIAQELEEVLPELVSDTDPKTVNYNGLIGVLIEAIKELSEEVQELKSQLNN